MGTFTISHPEVEKAGKVRSIHRSLSDPSVKLWMLFLYNILPIFDKYNINFQTSKAATIHKFYSESENLLKLMFTFFVKTSVIREGRDLMSIDYSNSDSQLSNDEIFIGDDATAYLLHMTEESGFDSSNFYMHVRSFYEAFANKLKLKFDFKSKIFQCLKLLDPTESQNLSLSTFDTLSQNLAIEFDLGKVKMEFREFEVDNVVSKVEDDAVWFWNRVKCMKTLRGECKYQHLCALALHLLSIPASNTDSERVFSLVRRIKTDFRSNLIPDSISSLIGVHVNSPFRCCSLVDFSASLLDKVKSCTREFNKTYGQKR